MVDDVNIMETAESKAAEEALDRARLARERREAEQRKRLEELRAHAAAAQAQREKRDEDRRRRLAEQRAKDDDRRQQVEERKRAIWEASISRREALLQREKDRTERLERARAARSAPRPAFAFGSSTPRLLEPLDNGGFFWAARSTNPIDQMNFFESMAASTSNVMFASAPLTRRASALHLDSDTDNKDEPDRSPATVVWSSVARRRTDLMPTLPAPRAPGRAYSMTRLDRLPAQPRLHSTSPSMHHLNRTQARSGDTTPGSRPGSALSSTPVVRRATTSTPRRPRPASIAGTGVNTPRGGIESLSVATTPTVSRDSSVAGADVPRRPASTPRRPRPLSLHTKPVTPSAPAAPGEGKPPLHRKPKPSKDHDKTPRGKSLSASPGRTLSPSPATSKEPSVDKELTNKVHPQELQLGKAAKKHKEQVVPKPRAETNHVNAEEVTQKLEALQIDDHSKDAHKIDDKMQEIKEGTEKIETKIPESDNRTTEPEQKLVETMETDIQKQMDHTEMDVPKPLESEQVEKKEDRVEEKKESSQEKTDEFDMNASMSARRITTEEEAKAALAERRRRAREELERQAEKERLRLQREAEEEAERQRLEEERQRREEEEARELVLLQRKTEEEKLRKAIEARQQQEREEAERKAREESERQARLKEDEDKRRMAEEAEKLRREEAEKEEKERLARKQRVEAIMARTRLKKAEEDKKSQENKQSQPPNAARGDNGNAHIDLLTLDTSTTQPPESQLPVEAPAQPAPAAEVAGSSPANNGNHTADLLGLSQQNNTADISQEQSPNKQTDTQTTYNNGNVQTHGAVGHVSANFIQTERMSAERQNKMADIPNLLDDDFATHNGHHNHPLTLQNAI